MDGKEAVVVKRIRDLKQLSSKEFTRQLHIIAYQKHPNLLPLLAYYNSKDEKLLVYKYAEKGNLFNRIHGIHFGESEILSEKVKTLFVCKYGCGCFLNNFLC